MYILKALNNLQRISEQRISSFEYLAPIIQSKNAALLYSSDKLITKCVAELKKI